MAVALVCVTACQATPPPAPLETTGTSSPTHTVSVAPTGPESGQANTNAVHADEQIVSQLECEPLSDALLARMKTDFGTPTRSVQVKVGEGNQPGESWWVVVLDSPPDDAYQWGIRQFLTNAQNGDGHWQWIVLPEADGLTWQSVHWDQPRLVRAESARTKARRCLDG